MGVMKTLGMTRKSMLQQGTGLRARGTIEGAEELARKFARLGGPIGRRAMRAALNAALTVVARYARARVNATPAVKAELKAQARRLIGKRFKKQSSGVAKGQVMAKTGFSVGSASKKEQGWKGMKGVGISAQNIHWFVLGTDERRLWHGSARGPKALHPTGRIRPLLSGIMQDALAMSQTSALAAARTKISQILSKEASRKG